MLEATAQISVGYDDVKRSGEGFLSSLLLDIQRQKGAADPSEPDPCKAVQQFWGGSSSSDPSLGEEYNAVVVVDVLTPEKECLDRMEIYHLLVVSSLWERKTVKVMGRLWWIPRLE